jgi:hypothetical protein
MECDVKFEGKPQGLSKIKRLMPMHGNCLVSGVAGYGRRPGSLYRDFVFVRLSRAAAPRPLLPVAARPANDRYSLVTRHRRGNNPKWQLS